MYSTTAYIYQQIQRILLIDTSGVGDVFDRRWEPVYAKKLTINKGVDNVILFEFINQDQKPVNITGSTLMFRLINLQGDVQLLEKEMDRMDEQLEPLQKFILPGGHPTVSHIHVARCVCRRTERLVVNLLIREEDHENLIIQYMNRLSDYLFILGRYVAKKLDVEETSWDPRV